MTWLVINAFQTTVRRTCAGSLGSMRRIIMGRGQRGPLDDDRNRAVLSPDAVTMRDPSGLNAAEYTSSSWPRRTAISLALAASQMRAVLSIDAVTMRDPSVRKAADFTSSSWPRRTAISLALAASQMRAVLSRDAVTMRDPSGLNAAECTTSSWPRRTAISL